MRKILKFLCAVGHGLWAVVSPGDYNNILMKEKEREPAPDPFNEHPCGHH